MPVSEHAYPTVQFPAAETRGPLPYRPGSSEPWLGGKEKEKAAPWGGLDGE